MGKKDLKSHVQSKRKGGYWKGGKKGHTTYEGTQYTGGRKEGRKNLKKIADGYVQNQHGVVFSDAQRKALENEVNKANYRRKKMLKEEAALPRKVGGKDTGQTVSQLQLMGKESDFILSRKSKSLQGFKSVADFENYLDNLRRVNSPTYIEDSVRLYKRNHMKALENVFGDDAKDVMMKIRMMKPADYMKAVQSDEELEVSYVYDPSERAARLNRIRAALGMKLKEEEIFEE